MMHRRRREKKGAPEIDSSCVLKRVQGLDDSLDPPRK